MIQPTRRPRAFQFQFRQARAADRRLPCGAPCNASCKHGSMLVAHCFLLQNEQSVNSDQVPVNEPLRRAELALKHGEERTPAAAAVPDLRRRIV